MSEKTYKLSTILKFIEKYYENVLTDERITEIKIGLNNVE